MVKKTRTKQETVGFDSLSQRRPAGTIVPLNCTCMQWQQNCFTFYRVFRKTL